MDREEEFDPSFQDTFPAPFSGNIYTSPYDNRAEGGSGSISVEGCVVNNTQLSSSSLGCCTENSSDKLSFADAMQLAGYRQKQPMNQLDENGGRCEENASDPAYFLKFPVLNEKPRDQQTVSLTSIPETMANGTGRLCDEAGENEMDGGFSENSPMQFVHHLEVNPSTQKFSSTSGELRNKKKRPRRVKTSEEVESQRMTHITVERNRRRQMNEHLRALRSFMPGSYVQRGDQASIIGGAIEFIRELEQLLQCLESQKRRRMLGGNEILLTRPSFDSQPPAAIMHQLSAAAPIFHPGVAPLADDQRNLVDLMAGFREELAENKSCLADVEVKLRGFDAMIKILSKRRPAQLLTAMAALEDLQLSILHTNITTIEQTVLYSFNVKMVGDTRFTAEDIANSVQQIFSFIHSTTPV